MDNVVLEIIDFGNCSSYDDFMATVDKITRVSSSEVVAYMTNMKQFHDGYVKKLLAKYRTRSSKDDLPEKNIVDMLSENSAWLFPLIICCDEIVLINGRRMSAYSVLKHIGKHFDDEYIRIFTKDIDDYVACYIHILNIFYSNGLGRNIDHVLVHGRVGRDQYCVSGNHSSHLRTDHSSSHTLTDHSSHSVTSRSIRFTHADDISCRCSLNNDEEDDVSHDPSHTFTSSLGNDSPHTSPDHSPRDSSPDHDEEYVNGVFIGTNAEALCRINCKNMISLLPVAKITDVDDATGFKEMLLQKYRPTMFLTTPSDDFILATLAKSSPLRIFEMDPNTFFGGDSVFVAKEDWIGRSKRRVLDDTTKMIMDMLVYEENFKHMKAIADIKSGITLANPYSMFSVMNVSRKMCKVTVALKDVLCLIKKSNSTNRDQCASDKARVPYLASVDYNNGITGFVEKHDTVASPGNPVISIGLFRTGKGHAFVHCYNFAHASNVALFRMNSTTINPFNLAFAITAKLTSEKLPDYISAKWLQTLSVDVFVSEQ